MKKILIVNKSFELGGIQSALKNMLSALSDTDAQIDLMLFNDMHKGNVSLPDNVNLLSPCLPVKTMGMTMGDALKSKNPLIIILKVLFTLWSKVFGNSLPIAFALLFQKKLTGYDYAVAYHHETGSKTTVTGFVRFILKKCDAKIKIGWMHSDLRATGTRLASKAHHKLYSKLDKIICVSKATMDSFTESFPELADKCDYCYNCLPIGDVLSKAEAEPDFEIKRDGNELILFSAGRLCSEKGFERTIDAMIPLFNEGFNFKWYIAGSGPLQSNIENKIRENGLENKIILMGYQSNPYPYMKAADWFILSSFHETFSMVVAESVLLGTPVLATDIPVMRELIDESCGYICENSTDGIRKGLKAILSSSCQGYNSIALKDSVKNTATKIKGVFGIL